MRFTEPGLRPEEDFDREIERPGEIRLFQAVVAHAVYEALSGSKHSLDYIRNDPDFDLACDLADWNSDAIRCKVEGFVSIGRQPQAVFRLGRRDAPRKDTTRPR